MNCDYCGQLVESGSMCCTYCGGRVKNEPVQKRASRILREPDKLSTRNIECHNCRALFVVSENDVLGRKWRTGITIEKMPPKGIWEKLGSRWSDKEADGYEYSVECPICKHICTVYDPLCNFEIRSYESP